MPREASYFVIPKNCANRGIEPERASGSGGA
jgi:hypothetical protein